MGPLRNQRHERYALAVAEGHSILESYRLAGYQKNTSNASRLNANESIQARVAELQQQTAASSRITIESICAELARGHSGGQVKGSGSGRAKQWAEWLTQVVSEAQPARI